jgi:hypothetical protein
MINSEDLNLVLVKNNFSNKRVNALLWTFQIGDRKMYILKEPTQQRHLGHGEYIPTLSLKKATELAHSYQNLILELAKCFGAGQVAGTGLISGQANNWNDRCTFSLFSITNSTDALKKSLEAQGPLSGEALYRLERRSQNPDLFTIKTGHANVSGFANKTSPLRIGAKAISADLVERFDKNIDNNSSDEKTTAPFSIDEMIKVLQETRKYAVQKLESVKVEATDANVTEMLKFLQVKSYRVVKETLAAMPYLKVERELDKNLALMVGAGLTYERILVFNISENYPADKETMDTIVDLPHSWMIRLVG